MRHTIVAMEDVGTAEIVWDDGAGTVTGDHTQVAELSLAIANPPMMAYCPWGSVALQDPAHFPADFLTALRSVLW